jgi:Concanavalin A-like lectin/glucanases superfamily
MTRAHGLAVLAAVAGAWALGACAHAPAGPGGARATGAPVPDSITVALWHMDETGGVVVADSGPFRIAGTAGIETRPDFGRFRNARRFVRSVESFVIAEGNPVFESARGITVEAWVRLDAYGQYELTPIASRWTQAANEQSWMFAIVGGRTGVSAARLPSPGFFNDLVTVGSRGQLLFAFQPDDAGTRRSYLSPRPIELQRWTHVAATFDGTVVKMFVDGLLETQFATTGRIRATSAPVLIGNAIDPRFLSALGGDLRTTTGSDPNPYYAFEGMIDEVRISNLARREFSEVPR